MNRRDVVVMTDDEVAAYLGTQDKLVFATLRATGVPHLTVMAFQFVDGTINMLSYGRAQKVVNLRRDPRCSCLADTRGEYRDFKGVEFVGVAELIDEAEDVVEFVRRNMSSSRFPTEANKVTPEQMASKRVLIRVHPEQTLSWDHSKLGGVY